MFAGWNDFGGWEASQGSPGVSTHLFGLDFGDSAHPIGLSCQLQDLLLSLPFFFIVLILTVCPFVFTPIFPFPETAAQRANRAAIQLYKYIFCVSLTLRSVSVPLLGAMAGEEQGGWKYFIAIIGLNKRNKAYHSSLTWSEAECSMNKLITLYLRQFKHFRTKA